MTPLNLLFWSLLNFSINILLFLLLLIVSSILILFCSNIMIPCKRHRGSYTITNYNGRRWRY